ncbi:potassium-transporting ATPase subunit B, partial [Streptomyces sp. NPDC056295]
MTNDLKKHEDDMSTATAAKAPHGDLSGGHHAPGRVGGGLFDPKQLVKSFPDAVRKLDPRVMIKSPVMFVVLV